MEKKSEHLTLVQRFSRLGLYLLPNLPLGIAAEVTADRRRVASILWVRVRVLDSRAVDLQEFDESAHYATEQYRADEDSVRMKKMNEFVSGLPTPSRNTRPGHRAVWCYDAERRSHQIRRHFQRGSKSHLEFFSFSFL